MAEPTEGLERRILLRLLKGALPGDFFSNALQRKAVVELKRLRLVRTNSNKTLVLTARGQHEAERLEARRATAKARLVKQK